jgi:hypothetical protein
MHLLVYLLGANGLFFASCELLFKYPHLANSTHASVTPGTNEDYTLNVFARLFARCERFAIRKLRIVVVYSPLANPNPARETARGKSSRSG